MSKINDYMDQTFSTWPEYDPRTGKWSDTPKAFPDTYGDWNHGGPHTHGIPKYLSGSDYSGTLVERSNRDCWREDFAAGEDQWWVEVSGGHGTFAIVVRLDALPDEAIEFLERLDTYPLADEDANSQLETEAQIEAWDNWAARDFVRALGKKFGCEIDGSAEDLFTVFSELMDRTNTYWENEQGDSMYIDMKRIVKGATESDVITLRKVEG
jgi:hypothetical protein